MQSEAKVVALRTDPTTPSPTRRPERNWAAERQRLNDETRWCLSTAERFVLDAIEVHIAAHEEGWPTQRRIALQTGISERQVRRVIEKLVSAGFLHARVVPAHGQLPNGERTYGVRLVYSRGTPRGRPLLAPLASASRSGGGGHGVRSGTPPPCGHDVRGVPDMMSEEWKEELKEQNKNTLLNSGSLDREPVERRESDFSSMEIAKEPEKDAAVRVLEHWRGQLWPDLRGPLDSLERARIVRLRLAQGFTEQELRHVVDAAKVSSWHQVPGEGQRLTISVLFGKPEMVTQLSERGRVLATTAVATRAVPVRHSPPEGPACDPVDALASAQRLLAMLSQNEGRPRGERQASDACAPLSLVGGG